MCLKLSNGLPLPLGLDWSIYRHLVAPFTLVTSLLFWHHCSPHLSAPSFVPQKDQVSLVAQLVKNLPAMRETWVQSLGWEDPLENGKATHSSILAWRIPWTVYSPWHLKESDTTERLLLSLSTLAKEMFFLPSVPPTVLLTHHHSRHHHRHTHTSSSIDCYAPTRSQLFLGTTWVRSSMIYFHDTIFLFFKALISFCIYIFLGLFGYLSLVKPMRTNLYLLNNPVSLEYRPVLETCCCCC